METLSTTKRHISGKRVIELLSIALDTDEIPSDDLLSMAHIKDTLIFGEALHDDDTVFVDGKDVRGMLQVQGIGNHRLGLLATLDLMPPDMQFRQHIHEDDAPMHAAD